VIVPAPLRRQRARRNRQNCLLLAVDVKSLPVGRELTEVATALDVPVPASPG
jgi:hypothetical protein